MKLLIVDDSSIIRSRIMRALANPRLKHALTVVGLAANGEEALRIFSKERPDIVTMDLTMPHMDGVQCTETMISQQPNTNILVVSALSDKATAILALKKGAKGFVYKPFTDDQLVDALLEVMN